MWSIGAILFELLNGYPPFHGRTSVQVTPLSKLNSRLSSSSCTNYIWMMQLLQNIKESSYLPFSQLVLSELHPTCVDLCSRLLSVNPGLDPTLIRIS